MGLSFGQRKADAPPIMESDGKYLRNFKDGDTVIRFIEEPDDWIVFREHYTTDRRSFPCTEDRDSCPGCTSDVESVQRATRKYGTNVWLVKQDVVLPFRIPMSLAKRVFSRAERNEGVITNRDYVVMKSGKGMDTEYDIESDERYTVNLKDLLVKGLDVQEILSASYDEIWGEKEDSALVKAAKPRERKQYIGDLDDEPSAKRLKDEEEFPSDPEPAAAEDDGPVVIDEDALYEMDMVELKDLAKRANVKVASTAKKSDVIRALISASE
jgi:hypothetical protein